MPSFYTFHESNFSQVQMVKIELSKNKLPKYCFSSCFCETFCTYKVTKYNAQSLVPDITKHLPLVPEDPSVNFLFRILVTVRTVNAQSCTALHRAYDVMCLISNTMCQSQICVIEYQRISQFNISEPVSN